MNMKVVGSRRTDVNSWEDMRILLRTVAALRPSFRLVPRGVYRFHSFEEADQWMLEMMTDTVVRHSSKISLPSAAR